MVQYALPISDFSVADWPEGAGDGDGDAFDEVDEGHGAGRGSGSGPDDATTYRDNTGDPGFAAGLQVNMSAVTDPGVDTGHITRSQSRKNASAGKQIDIIIRLQQETTLISFKSFFNVDDIWTVRVHPIAESDIPDITDYSLLRIRLYANEVGGGGPRRGQESALEFECPDAPGGGGFAHSQGVIVG